MEALCELLARFALGGAISAEGGCFPLRRLRWGPAHNGFGRLEKSGMKLRLCSGFFASGCKAAWNKVLCTCSSIRKRGLWTRPAARPSPSAFKTID